MTRLKYCHIQGKVRFPTYYAAWRVHKALNHKHHHLGGCVYHCFYCHDYHITHYDEPVKPEDLIMAHVPPNKKQKRSLRRKARKRYLKRVLTLPKYKIALMTVEDLRKQLQERIEASRAHDLYVWNEPDFVKLRHRLNLCFLLADVIDSWLIDIVPQLKVYSTMFDDMKTYQFAEIRQRLWEANKEVQAFAKVLYHEDSDTEQAAIDSDWLKDLLWLINDRIDDHDTSDTQLKMLSMIKNSFKSKYKLT